MARLGEWDYRRSEAEAEDFGIKTKIRHPRFEDEGRPDHDIALLELDRRVAIGGGVRPICLPAPGALLPTTAVATGWGRLKQCNALSFGRPPLRRQPP